MRRAALPQVDLDGVGAPRAALRAGDDEVESEASEDALACEPAADLRGFAADARRVGLVRGEPAAEVALTADPAEQLVVRREQLERAQRGHPQLHAGAADLVGDDALFHDPALLGELLQEHGVGQALQLEGHGREQAAHGVPFVRRARRREPRQVEVRVPGPRHALVELDHHAAQGRVLAAHRDDGFDERVLAVEVLPARGVRDALLAEEAAAAALRAERDERRIAAVHRDAEP